jgi:hypothetical protein
MSTLVVLLPCPREQFLTVECDQAIQISIRNRTRDYALLGFSDKVIEVA